MCDNRHYISEAPLSLNSVRRRVEAFLAANGLRLAPLDRYVGVTREEGRESVKACTKPENEGIFKSLGFGLLASAPKAILMENGRGGLPEYKKYLASLARPGRNGAI